MLFSLGDSPTLYNEAVNESMYFCQVPQGEFVTWIKRSDTIEFTAG
jgi:hypothetical protein